MPTIIDSLLVKLGLDNSEFIAGSKKVESSLKGTGGQAEDTGRKLKNAGNDGAKGFEALTSSATRFLALIGGTVAVKRFVEQTVQSNAELYRLSQNLKENVETVSALSNATQLFGGSAQGLQGTLDMLSRSQTELALTGQSSLIPYFTALRVNLADTQGKARPVSDILLDLADRFSKMDRTTANNMGRMFGIDQGTMNLLLQGRKEVELLLAKQKEFNATTKQQAEEAARLTRAFESTRQGIHAFGMELLSNATPAIEVVFEKLSQLGDWIIQNKEFVKTFLSILTVGLVGLAAAVIPINTVIVAITALSAAMALLYQDYQTWKSGGETFIPWEKWKPGFDAAGFAIEWLKGLMNDLIYRAIAAADYLSALFNRDWKRMAFAKEEFLSGAPATGNRPPEGQSKQVDRTAKGVMDFFTSKGWTPEQAAGIASNLHHESGFKHDAKGDNGKAYGIAQWHPDRQNEFKKVFGKDIKESTFEDQLAFVQFELTAGKEKSAGDKLKGATNAADAGAIVSKFYERPANREFEADRRGRMAEVMAGIPDASQMAASGPQATQNTNEVHIGEVVINTAATDAQGIARDMKDTIDSLFTSQSNFGMR